MDLPEQFDVVVSGTGLIESIVSAACARVGKSVFHVDRNEFYGSVWASFSFDELNAYLNKIQNLKNEKVEKEEDKNLHEEQNKKWFNWIRDYQPLSNVEIISYLIEKEESDEKVESNPANITEMERPEEKGEEKDKIKVEQNGLKEETQEGEMKEESKQGKWWTREELRSLNKYFNLDLCPRLLYSTGSMVDLLVSSNISRYLSFKNMTRLLCQNPENHELIELPYSKQSIFLSQSISLIEKRLLMRFMEFCLEKKHAEELQSFAQRPFIDLMQSKQLTPLLQNLVLNCLAFAPHNEIKTEEALQQMNKFINSTGKYGNTPFLCTTYGSGEMQQSFCRLSAVFGSTYWLSKSIEAVVTYNNQQKTKMEVLFDQKRIKCNFLISGAAATPTNLITSENRKQISRAIFITDNSIKKITDSSMINRECTFASLPKSDLNSNPVSLLEYSSTLFVCPENLYLVYLWCNSSGSTAKNDFLPITKRLFNFNQRSATSSSDNLDGQRNKPNVIWSCYFNQEYVDCQSSFSKIDHHFIVSTPCNEIDYDSAIAEAKTTFHKMYPEEEFLPRAPNPEEIIFDDEQSEQPENVVE